MYGRQLASVVMVLAVATLALPVAANEAVPQMQDQRGRSFTLPSLRGTPLVVTFVAGHCTDACPLINAQFRQLAAHVRQRRIPVRLLTITLDPEHDSPATMRGIAKTFDADPSQWIVAGGNRRDVHAVMRAFNVVAQQGRRGYADAHTTFVYVLNKHGVLRTTMLASRHLDDDVVAELDRNWKELTR